MCYLYVNYSRNRARVHRDGCRFTCMVEETLVVMQGGRGLQHVIKPSMR